MRSWLAVLFLLAGWLRAGPAGAADLTLTVTVNGQARIAFVHTPAKLDSKREYPLVIGFHGGAGNARGYIETSQLFAKGEAAGFIVVCPQGTPITMAMAGDHRIWNSGAEYERPSGGADDVLFTRTLIDKVSATYPVDPKRVYVTGFSNGGQMAYRLALQLSDRIAAIAPMSGGRLASGPPSRPVPVLHVHGAADSVYPIAGGLGPHSLGRTSHAPIGQVIAEWVRFNGADPRQQTTSVQGADIGLHAGPAPVMLVVVEGMGHQIAGGRDDHLPDQAMRSMPDAVGMALRFFEDHPMP